VSSYGAGTLASILGSLASGSGGTSGGSAQMVFSATYKSLNTSDLYTVTNTNTWAAIPYNQITLDLYSGWNSSTSTWTAPSSGMYLISARTALANTPFRTTINVSLNINGNYTTLEYREFDDADGVGGSNSGAQTSGHGGAQTYGDSTLLSLNAGDHVGVVVGTGYGGVYVLGTLHAYDPSANSTLMIIKL
jgi:hypothetical protein